MANIKTRELIKGKIKTIDKSKIAGERVKSAHAKTKDRLAENERDQDGSEKDYASSQVMDMAKKAAKEGAYQFDKQGRAGVDAIKENAAVVRKGVESFKGRVASQRYKNAKGQKTDEYTSTRSRRTFSEKYIKGKATRRSGKEQAATVSKHRAHLNERSKLRSLSRHEQGRGIKRASRTTKNSQSSTVKSRRMARSTAKTSQKAAQLAKTTAKNSATAVKTASKIVVSSVKGLIAGTKALVSAIAAGGWIAVTVILIVVLLGSAITVFGGGNDNSYTPVSAEVQAYEPVIQRYARQHGIAEYVELIKAVMMQESGGRGADPMQASECGFNTRFPRGPNTITDPEYSIDVGIQNLAACLREAETKSPIDMDGIKLALQGFNFGNGYISWAKTNHGGYSYQNAVEFSTMMAQQNGWSSYGDTQYVANVLRYYPFGQGFSGVGNQGIVQVALSQLGNQGGQPYWSWYGFGGRVEWCACFVSWCAEQCGYLESGAIPKFSYCPTGVDWFKDKGQWQGRGHEPAPGDVIFFDYNDNGSADHVGLVERCEGGVVYTIEGNSGDACRQMSYAVGDGSIWGYGTPGY